MCVADFLGCALLGSTRSIAQDLLHFAEALGGRPTASVIGSSVMTSPTQAALVNGIIGGASPSLEDTALESFGHPGINVVPAALAVAEHLGLDRKDLLLAVVAGYELAMRAGAAAGWRTFGKGWHPRGGFNVFGAAAAAGKLLELSEDQFCAALGLAGVQASGLAEPCKPYHAWYLLSGASAQAGVLASLLAARGWTAGDRVFEGPLGFLNVIAAEPDPGRLTIGLGQRFEIMQVTRKRHASSSTTHSAIDAILELRSEHQINAEDVHTIQIETAALASLLSGEYPRQHLEQNLRYLAAVAVVQGDVGDAEMTMHHAADPRVRNVFERTSVVGVSELTGLLPLSMAAIVTVVFKSGRRVSRRRDFSRGDPRERLSDVELKQKFRRSASAAASESNVEAIWDWLMEGTAGSPVGGLMELTRAE